MKHAELENDRQYISKLKNIEQIEAEKIILLRMTVNAFNNGRHLKITNNTLETERQRIILRMTNNRLENDRQ